MVRVCNGNQSIATNINSTGAYQVTLYAYNEYGLRRQLPYKPVNAIIEPSDWMCLMRLRTILASMVLYCLWFGIRKNGLCIYNRWGQLIFIPGPTAERTDGMERSKQQAMDVYTYTLDCWLPMERNPGKPRYYY